MKAKIKTTTDNKDWETLWLDIPYMKIIEALQARRQGHQMLIWMYPGNKVYK